MEGLAARITPLKLNIKRLSLQSSVLNAWVVSGSQPYLTGHFSSWERHQLLLCPFFLFSFNSPTFASTFSKKKKKWLIILLQPFFICLPLVLFKLKPPPIFRVNSFQHFYVITCTYLFMWKYYTSGSISCSHFLWFHPRKGFVFQALLMLCHSFLM